MGKNMEEKSLSSLLEDKRVVPEIQREYVWGAEEGVIENFLTNLNDQVGQHTNLGFLYSYTSDGEYHLIDGQQRFTTLVLIAIYCAKLSSIDKSYKSLLGMFSYRVRTATDEFLSSLINDDYLSRFDEGFLLQKKYFHANSQGDLSISSMIKGLNRIHSFRKNQGENFKLSYDWIISNVYFWTFDVSDTSQGEELYISMNSRGEQLTQSEQIKPMLLANADKENFKSLSGESWGKIWDNWEEFIFTRNYNVSQVNVGMDNFIILCLQIKTGKPRVEIKPLSDSEEISMKDLECFFSAFSNLYSLYPTEMAAILSKEFHSAEQVMALSLLATYYHNPDDIRDVYHSIKVWESRSLIDFRKRKEFLTFLNGYMSQKDTFYHYVSNLYDNDNNALIGITTHHEVLKIKLSEDFQKKDLFWRADDFHVTHGHLRGIWYEVFEDSYEWTSDTISRFIKRQKVFEELFAEENTKVKTSSENAPTGIDNTLITKALIAIDKGNYHIRTSASNYAFGYQDSNNEYWSSILKDNMSALVISGLIDELETTSGSLLERLNAIISKGKEKFDTNDVRFYILNYESSLCAQWEGYNIICMDNRDDWTNFKLYIYDKYTGHSNYSGFFEHLVYNEVKEKYKQLGVWLYNQENGLTIRSSNRRGWDLKWESYKGDKEILKQNLVNFLRSEKIIDDETTRANKVFFIPLVNENQVDLGIKLCDFIAQNFNI